MSEALLRTNQSTVWPVHEQVQGTSNVFTTTSMGVYYITVCSDSQHDSSVYYSRLDNPNEITSPLHY